ncbi:MAG: peptidoglycan editing factor PgeF [Eubacterium sp.]|nr:peptidoglycan editing factor PgeF [Eubacterium sp.]
MQYKNQIEVPYLTGTKLPVLKYPLLESVDCVKHLFTTRMGGVSSGIYDSLNLSFDRGDDETCVMENYRRVAEYLGVGLDDIVTSRQMHTTNVRVVGREDGGAGLTKQRTYEDVDGLLTNEKNLVLATFFADCVPLYFVDPVHEAIALSHSGWRGTAGKMGKVTVEAMAKEYGTQPEDVICAIGPSICQECYEVSEEVAVQFPKEVSYRKADGKYQLDLWRANELVLLEAGVLPDHIQTTKLCTCCNEKELFSHRASKGKRGNLGAFLMLV